jgi:hypothetical protein
VRLFSSAQDKDKADHDVGVVGLRKLASSWKEQLLGVDPNTSRVCYFCYLDLESGSHDVQRALELCEFQVPDLIMLKSVWPGPARDCLAKLVSLQSVLSIDDATVSHELIVRNRQHIVGHSRLMVQWNRALDWNHAAEVEEFISLASVERRYKCIDLGCDLNLCHAELGFDDGVEMLVSCPHVARDKVCHETVFR